MPKTGDKVAMSGGVDSSVAALNLSKKDYDLSAVYMRNWDTRDESGSDIGCEWEKDWEDVQRVDLSTQYWISIFKPALDDWQSGYLTPNPDDAWLATGHYANIKWSKYNRPKLYRAHDRKKDQTYFLSCLYEHNLEKTIFPIGGLLKSQVRQIAHQHNLPTAKRSESMGLCFVGERRKFNDFLSNYLISESGEIIDPTGKSLGRHTGLWKYTIGQGAKIPGLPKRMYVAWKDPENNRLLVVPGQDHPYLFTSEIQVNNWHWISSDFKLLNAYRLRVQIRHLMLDIRCNVTLDTNG
ncbi:hypothetical protein Clacol_006779 [Clathrus columnatus]|uniref:tRNA-5-taurinomethyluridine 2-sulfurtransferase n=1 Tax=Clathrus columnatus TaxID=1419009 RepID=A0AAV5AHV3_9AGAM|nr:hypothetical protein Clacol_006779 [Clathrus columnatus]